MTRRTGGHAGGHAREHAGTHALMLRCRSVGRIAAAAALLGGCHVPPQTAPRPTSGSAAQASTPISARPVASVLDVHWLLPGTDTMVITREADAAPVVNRQPTPGSAALADTRTRIAIGMTIQRVRRMTDAAGHDAFEVAFEQRDSSSVLVETTTWVNARTLQPLRQLALLEDGRVVTLGFGRGEVVMVDSGPGRLPRMSASPVPDSAYTSAAIDLVLRALPLSMGFRATVPVYFPADEQVVPLDVRVEGADRITTRGGRVMECWVVAADFPGDVTERFWIDQRSHAMIRILAHEGVTNLVRYDR